MPEIFATQIAYEKDVGFLLQFYYLDIVEVVGFFFLTIITAVNSGYWFNPVTSTQSEPPFCFEDKNAKIL